MPRDSQDGILDGLFFVLVFSVDEILFCINRFYEQ